MDILKEPTDIMRFEADLMNAKTFNTMEFRVNMRRQLQAHKPYPLVGDYIELDDQRYDESFNRGMRIIAIQENGFVRTGRESRKGDCFFKLQATGDAIIGPMDDTRAMFKGKSMKMVRKSQLAIAGYAEADFYVNWNGDDDLAYSKIKFSVTVPVWRAIS